MNKVRVTISRDNSDNIYIRIVDSLSRIEFVDVCMRPPDFAKAITGFAMQEGVADIRGLDKVGKEMIDEMSFTLPPHTSWEDRKKIATEIAQKTCKDGWIPDISFNSQYSFFNVEGVTCAKTTIRKWVTPDVEK